MYHKKWDYNLIFTYGALVGGVILGCLVLLLTVMIGNTTILDMGLEDYKIGAVLNISSNQMMKYVLKKRIIQFVVFIMFIYLFPYFVTSVLFCGSFGVYYGIVLTNLIIKYDIMGLLYGIVCFYPHYFIYFLIIYFLGKWNKRTLNFCYQSMNWIDFLGKIFVILFLICISLTWEIRFQKIFLNYFFQHLV